MQSKATVSYQGGKQSYTFPFPYLSKQFVKVRYEGGSGTTNLEYNRDYSVEGQSVLLRSVAPANVTVYVYRQTPTSSLVDFNDGSLLLASAMDKMAAQLLHVEEENSDFLLNSAMVTDDDGAWQGRGRRIKNLRDPQNPHDAVTLNYLDSIGVARQDELQRIEQAVRADKERALSFKNDAASYAQSAASSASSSAQSAAASEVSRQASAVIENNIKGVQNTIRDMQNHVNGVSAHVDGVKTSVETIAVRVASDSQHASDEAGKAHSSAEASAQSAAASEASAKRAEQASKFEGIVKSENIAKGAITKTKIGFTAGDIDTYTKSETNELLAQKAPLASPALTGTPTVPTAGKGTNNGQIASTAFVAQAIAALVNSAPGALDTLQELAVALGNDANFATTVTNALAGKLGKNETAARAAEWVGWSLERNRFYVTGGVAYYKTLPSWARLTCAKEGTTAATLPVELSREWYIPGAMFEDGTAIWIIDDIRDGTPFGSVRGDLRLPPGYVKANGATVLRADYPRLLSIATYNNLWTDDPASNPGRYGIGDGSTTMVLPNYTDRMIQFAADGVGQGVTAGLPNITGTFAHLSGNGYANMAAKAYSGAFSIGPTARGCTAEYNTGTGESGSHFDASKSNPIYGRSNTVQPAAIKLIPIIRY